MGLIASLPEIDRLSDAVFVMHERSEKLIPLHTHRKGQLSYVDGGIAYITRGNKTYVVPARHYFWIPAGMPHVLRIGHSGTVLRSLYYGSFPEEEHPYFCRLGIYPASELLIQMISHTERWDEQHIKPEDGRYTFLAALRKLLPEFHDQHLSIVLPHTEDERMQQIIAFLGRNLGDPLTLSQVGRRFHMSERTVSRMFQSCLHMSFLQYLKTLRMVKAMELIVKTSRPIGEIAGDVGYDTPGAFSNTFQAFTGSRPSDFRKG